LGCDGRLISDIGEGLVEIVVIKENEKAEKQGERGGDNDQENVTETTTFHPVASLRILALLAIYRSHQKCRE